MNQESSSMLVVDDDQVFRSRLAEAFRKRNILAYEAGNSEEAIKIMREYKPSRAVLDLRIDKESGMELLKELVDLKRDLKAVILTGYGTIATAIDALKSGAVNYLTKPTNADSILASFEGDSKKSEASTPLPKLEQVEWEHINRVVKDYSGNISQASKALGLHRRSLQRKLNKVPNKLK